MNRKPWRSQSIIQEILTPFALDPILTPFLAKITNEAKLAQREQQSIRDDLILLKKILYRHRNSISRWNAFRSCIHVHRKASILLSASPSGFLATLTRLLRCPPERLTEFLTLLSSSNFTTTNTTPKNSKTTPSSCSTTTTPPPPHTALPPYPLFSSLRAQLVHLSSFAADLRAAVLAANQQLRFLLTLTVSLPFSFLCSSILSHLFVWTTALHSRAAASLDALDALFFSHISPSSASTSSPKAARFSRAKPPSAPKSRPPQRPLSLDPKTVALLAAPSPAASLSELFRKASADWTQRLPLADGDDSEGGDATPPPVKPPLKKKQPRRSAIRFIPKDQGLSSSTPKPASPSPSSIRLTDSTPAPSTPLHLNASSSSRKRPSLADLTDVIDLNDSSFQVVVPHLHRRKQKRQR